MAPVSCPVLQHIYAERNEACNTAFLWPGKESHYREHRGKKGCIFKYGAEKKPPKQHANYVSAYPVLSRKPVRPDIKERCRYHSGNTLGGRTAPRHSSAPPRTPASCTHNTHHPGSGGIPSARNSGKEKGGEKKSEVIQSSKVFGWVSRLQAAVGKIMLNRLCDLRLSLQAKKNYWNTDMLWVQGDFCIKFMYDPVSNPTAHHSILLRISELRDNVHRASNYCKINPNGLKWSWRGLFCNSDQLAVHYPAY